MNPNDYSLTAVLRAMVANTWTSKPSEEAKISRLLWAAAGEPPQQQERIARIPGYALRDFLIGGSPATGAALASGEVLGDYVPALRDTSAALRLGAASVSVPRGTATLATPRGTAGATAYWLADELEQITPSEPTIASTPSTPKTAAGLCTLSHQLLAQGANVEQVVRTELRRAVAGALDAAIFAGTGTNGQPVGLTGISGTGAFTGTSLNQAALRNAQRDVGTAEIVNPGALGYVTTPAVAETLATRARVASSDRMLWEGASHDGIVEGVRAISTPNMPTATVAFGDWSGCQVVEYAGGVLLEADPYGAFKSGLVSFRVLLDVDVVFLRPASFSLATSVT